MKEEGGGREEQVVVSDSINKGEERGAFIPCSFSLSCLYVHDFNCL